MSSNGLRFGSAIFVLFPSPCFLMANSSSRLLSTFTRNHHHLHPNFLSLRTMATSSSITLPSGLKIDQPTSLFYNASFHLPLDPTSTFPTVNPATGKEIVTLNEAKKEDVDLIVQAARKAYESDEWQDLSSTDRGKLLFKLADLVEEDKHIFAELESYDAGKTVASAILDVEEAIGVIR